MIFLVPIAGTLLVSPFVFESVASAAPTYTNSAMARTTAPSAPSKIRLHTLDTYHVRVSWQSKGSKYEYNVRVAGLTVAHTAKTVVVVHAGFGDDIQVHSRHGNGPWGHWSKKYYKAGTKLEQVSIRAQIDDDEDARYEAQKRLDNDYSSISKDEYYLSVAKSYGDRIRVSELTQEITTARSEISTLTKRIKRLKSDESALGKGLT